MCTHWYIGVRWIILLGLLDIFHDVPVDGCTSGFMQTRRPSVCLDELFHSGGDLVHVLGMEEPNSWPCDMMPDQRSCTSAGAIFFLEKPSVMLRILRFGSVQDEQELIRTVLMK